MGWANADVLTVDILVVERERENQDSELPLSRSLNVQVLCPCSGH